MRATLTLIATLLITTSTAEAGKTTLYIGAHPLGDGVFCVIEAPHQHTVAPIKPALFRVHGGYYHFVGDPVAFGYTGPKHAYVGNHPMHLKARLGVWTRDPESDLVYCYIEGPHYHAFVPDPTLEFKVKGDAYWYVGTFEPAYKRGKARYVKPVAAVYAEIDYPRPVIEVSPPAGFIGVVATPDGVVAGGGITAGVEVIVPRPTLEIGIGVGGHVHHDNGLHLGHRKHRHYKHKRRKRSKRWGYVRSPKSHKSRKRKRRRYRRR